MEHPSAAAVPAPVEVAEEFEPPKSLKGAERKVWLELAPHAFKAGTLLRATEFAFVVLCRNILLERAYSRSVTDRGTANHRGMIQRVEGGLDAFRLRPQGRPMPSSARVDKPESKLARFLGHG